MVPLRDRSLRARERRLLYEERARRLSSLRTGSQRSAQGHRGHGCFPLPPSAGRAGNAMSSNQPIDLRTIISRRKLLGGMSALTVALASPIWKSATAFGQDANAKAAKRFIGVFSANGTIAKQFFQTGAGS